MAKNSLERYTHYYERWAANQSVSIECGRSDLKLQIYISMEFRVTIDACQASCWLELLLSRFFVRCSMLLVEK